MAYKKSVRKALKALSVKSRTQAEIIKAYEEQIKRYRGKNNSIKKRNDTKW